MLILKHLKALQHVSIIIQIIFREFVSSLLKSLNLKFKNVKSQIWLFTFLNCKFSDFKKELTNYLKMIRIMIETCWSAFKCFNINILD